MTLSDFIFDIYFNFLSGCMCLVELPAKLYEHLDQVDYSAAESIQNQLFHSYQIEVNYYVIIIIIYYYYYSLSKLTLD